MIKQVDFAIVLTIDSFEGLCEFVAGYPNPVEALGYLMFFYNVKPSKEEFKLLTEYLNWGNALLKDSGVIVYMHGTSVRGVLTTRSIK